jgi:hypothetical protein
MKKLFQFFRLFCVGVKEVRLHRYNQTDVSRAIADRSQSFQVMCVCSYAYVIPWRRYYKIELKVEYFL